jgi:hypothetical protein
MLMNLEAGRDNQRRFDLTCRIAKGERGKISVIGEMPDVIHFAIQGLMPAVFAVRTRVVLF